jgi:hypothetical protein
MPHSMMALLQEKVLNYPSISKGESLSLVNYLRQEICRKMIRSIYTSK